MCVNLIALSVSLPVSQSSCLPVPLTPCPHVTVSVSLSPCLSLSPCPCLPVPLSSCLLISLSPCLHVFMSPCSLFPCLPVSRVLVSLSPCLPVSLSPCLPVTLSPYHPVTLSPLSSYAQEWLSRFPVPRYDAKDPRALALMLDRRPVILTNTGIAQPALEKWTLPYLAEHAGFHQGTFSQTNKRMHLYVREDGHAGTRIRT